MIHPMRTRHVTGALTVLATLQLTAQTPDRAVPMVADPTIYVDTRIGSSNGGNTFPGAVVPFGMVQWSPETSRGDATRPAAPGGYAFDAQTIRGFSLTHLSGTGCRGASGDIPFMPFSGVVKSSPSADSTDRVYAKRFAHANETAEPAYYQVRLEDGINVELTSTARTGVGRFTYPDTATPTMLVRTSDSEVGSSDAEVTIDRDARTISGSVTSGNFCGYLDPVNRRSYYTLHFVAVFDRPFASVGTWQNKDVKTDATASQGGTTYGTDGYPVAGMGSGAYVVFGPGDNAIVNVRVGISYVSSANARANLQAESPEGTTFESVRARGRDGWKTILKRITIGGGTDEQRAIFYTALYHALLHPNVFSDVNGDYWGMDQQRHVIATPQKAQHANFSGWDVYRSQVQLIALVDPAIAGDIAQSLLNQANQLNGVWDRWTHNTGATHVMEGDPSPATVGGIYAFGGTNFDVKAAYASLLEAATVPTKLDLSDEGCRVSCVGQRPSLDQWLSIHYIAAQSNAWGGAGETLEDVSADFALAQLARRVGDTANERLLLERSGYWTNIFNPESTPDGGYIQNRNKDGTWVRFDPASSNGFAEGSSAQYTWMIPFDPRGLFDRMGGNGTALQRLDGFFHTSDGGWALTRLGSLHAEMNNEPSINAPWLYSFAGRPQQTQDIIREVMKRLWDDTPYGIPGNDDLGAMSAWYVWSAMGFNPNYPGRAELLLATPLFPRMIVERGNGKRITINAPDASMSVRFVHGLRVNGRPSTRAWLPESFVAEGGTLDFQLAATPSSTWGAAPADVPPSFGQRSQPR
jgi:predicted alpha-1,2-mannosidase